MLQAATELKAGRWLPWALAGIFFCLHSPCVCWRWLPGALGVREAVMLILLRPVMAPEDGLLLIMALRLAALLGDLGAFPLPYAPRHCQGRASR